MAGTPQNGGNAGGNAAGNAAPDEFDGGAIASAASATSGTIASTKATADGGASVGAATQGAPAGVESAGDAASAVDPGAAAGADTTSMSGTVNAGPQGPATRDSAIASSIGDAGHAALLGAATELAARPGADSGPSLVLPATFNMAGSTLLAPATAAIAAPVGTPEFGGEVSRQLAVLASSGIQSAELSLQPAHLGPVHVSIQMNGLDAMVSISASHEATRVALQASLAHLGSLFQESGLNLAGAQVGDGSERSAGQDLQQGKPQGSGRPSDAPATARTAPRTEADPAAAPPPGSHLIDTFA